jgi:apolipoprotein N-acyltransferase
LLPALASAVLLWLAYFPADVGWLGWVALVPLLGLVRSPARPRRVVAAAYLTGLAFYVLALQWMRVADPRMYATWLLLSLYCALYFPAAIGVLRLLDRRAGLPLVLTAPVAWTALEFLRSTFGGGFSWYLLGHTQHDWLSLIQVSDLTGAWGVSFLVVAVNALLFELLWGRGWFRGLWGLAGAAPRWSRTALLAQALVVLPLLPLALAYGTAQLRREPTTRSPGPRVALLQSNLPQRVKNEPGEGEKVARHNIALCNLAAAYRPDLIVWPETSYPAYWEEVDADTAEDDVPDDWRRRAAAARTFAADVAASWRTDVLLGLNALVRGADGKERQYNSALLIDRSGRAAGRYDKVHRVPFGEYVPFRDWLPLMNAFAPYDFEYGVAAGRGPVALVSGGYSFGVAICYEDTDPAATRDYGAGRLGTDYLVNISNDGWFDGTAEHEQHLAICRFRAIECRRPVARAVNMGVSAVIDADGRVLAPVERELPTELASRLAEAPFAGERPRVWHVPPGAGALPPARWSAFKKVPGVVLAELPLDPRPSVYARRGDWLPWACWACLAGFVGLALARPRPRPVP